MRVLIYSPLAIYSPHFETDLELASLESDAGNEIVWLSCQGDLPELCVERARNKFACIGCKSRERAGLKTVQISKHCNFSLCKTPVLVPRFSSISEVKDFHYRGVDVGSTVLSTLISFYREPSLDLEIHRFEIEECCRKTIQLTDSFFDFLEKTPIDKAFLFNGRMMLHRPMVRVLEQKNIPFFVHERAGSVEKYSLTPNTYPHDLLVKKNEVMEFTRNYSEGKMLKDGSAWFEERRKGIAQSWPSFITQQSAGLLPGEASQKTKGQVISIFVSSEDEFECVSDWKNLIYKNQNDGIAQILNSLPDTEQVIIRIHPNLKGLNNSQVRGLRQFSRFKNCKVIEANDPTDSYALIEASDKIVTFGSTVGAEATFWGKPSILAGGRCLYEDLDVCYIPENHAAMMKLLSEKLVPKSRLGACRYASWEANFGILFRYFKPDGFFSGIFKGKRLAPSVLFRILNEFKFRKRNSFVR